ncbi:RHS repeat-associated protein [Chryseobacterium rhizosphaerae]|uniref:RHS repeat-associated protein n=2 Tax=Chryseobacterium TaxID=59732 RepID=A0AAE3YEH4_9FLAO|nr:DUF6443 domain-containing protein [Chryseobacterium rhizosphaerae]MDR6528982.1 RHS repeat-associated protein [Chryseobacterium rhizosphaerae]
MKKIIIPIGVLLTSSVQAQLTPLPNTENYIQAKTYLDYNGATASKSAETVQYFDGLGRPKQIVNVKASPQGKDVVTYFEYDGFGRQVKEYLPVPQSGTLNGAIVPNPLANATNTPYASEKIYAEKILENSPLDRIQQQIQVGNDWTGKPVRFGYDANVDGEVIKMFTTTTWENGATKSTIEYGGMYGENQLYKNTVTDEDGNQTIEFKNGKGQTLMVRKVMSTTENADTYYVYNEYDQLAWVIPPLLSKKVHWGWADQQELAYEYRYDGRNRLVEKKIPGKDWEYMVYDKQDRLVGTQDANLRAKGQWMYTKYDQFSRVIMTGICQAMGNSRLEEQNYANTKGSNSETRSTGISMDYSGMNIYYSVTQGYPQYDKVYNFLSLNYYDTYPVGAPAIPSQIQGSDVLQDNIQNSTVSTKGLPTASYVKNTEANDIGWTKNYTYYDTKGRSIGTHSINYLGGYTKTESELDFAGVPQMVVTKHKRLNTDIEKMITENFEYDTQNRLLVHKHQVDSNTVEILAQNTYNELSQLSNKKVGGTSLGSSLQSIDYAYNIRGWMTKINDPANLNEKLFGYAIRYNNPVNTPYAPGRYNGNIAEVDWRTSNDNILKRYSYSYYAQNRLMFGHYSEPLATVPENSLYDEYLEYDLNGNITVLSRNSKNTTSGTAIHIDSLGYTYEGNKLLKVTDGTQNNEGYPIGGNAIEYDSNGNMTKHLDKGIKNIKYNYLNLPNEIQASSTNVITSSSNTTLAIYRADGNKVKKTFTSIYNEGGITATSETETDYLDSFQYATNKLTGSQVLQFVPTSEGYFNFVKNMYIYNYTDHLGNIRLSYMKNTAGEVQVIEANNYYPFGLKHEGYSTLSGNPTYKYKYNGKELQETGMYDYGARMYMPDLGRWGVVDPLAEKSRRWSPYSYAFNNPIRFIDPDGRQNEDIIKVNAQGYVTQIEVQDPSIPHTVVDENGNQLNVNDSKFDQEQLDAIASYGRTMNDYELEDAGIRLFSPYSAQQMADSFNQVGIGDIKDTAQYLQAFGEQSYIMTPWMMYMGSLGHGQFDFAGDMGAVVQEGGNYPPSQGGGATPPDGTGGFIRFEGTNTLYNVYDAGNFMTGKAFQMIGAPLDVLKNGANTSSVLTGKGKDSQADQRAITNGYNYNKVGWKK